jgi:hypothetical protein
MRKLLGVSLIFAMIGLATLVMAPAHAAEQRAWVKGVPDLKTWAGYSKKMGADEFGKFIIDVKSNDIYFIDVNLFNIHADFVLGVLLKQPWTADNVREYNKNYEREKPRFILGYLTHHLKVNKWTYSFWEGDKADAATVVRVKKRLSETFFEKNILFRPDSPMQLAVGKEVSKLGIATITNDDIYKASPYQAFTKGTAVGTLHVVPVGTAYESLLYGRHDIVLLQESYPDITPVAGILATTFSTPLSHVNLRANAWGIPNAGDKNAREKALQLDGKTVFYQVTDTGMILREATATEIKDFEARVRSAKVIALPQANLTDASLAMLGRMRAKDVIKYGTKAANLGEVKSANLPGVRIPDGFGVPFFYYVRHMKQNKLDVRLDAMLSDPRWQKEPAWRRSELEKMRAAIQAAPVDDAVLDMLYKRIAVKLGGKGVFVRSSTNSEDLPGFNGAGLYDTVPNVVGRTALGEALKTVWASLWNLRAVEEREAFGIDHHQVYAGVLIQIGVNASAAGVLITRNLWNPSEQNSFTINAKWGLGMKVVEGQKVPEQILFDANNDGTKIISRSDDPTMLVFDKTGGIKEIPAPNGGIILTEARAKKLVAMVQAFMPLLDTAVPLDVEWVLEGDDFWIVQQRPFVGK